MKTNQTERVPDEELDQMILKLERDGMTPKQLSLMKEVREVRRAKGEPVAWWTGPEPTLTGEIESIHDHETGSHYIPLYAVPPVSKQ